MQTLRNACFSITDFTETAHRLYCYLCYTVSQHVTEQTKKQEIFPYSGFYSGGCWFYIISYLCMFIINMISLVEVHPFHPSIVNCLSGVGSWWQQPQQRVKVWHHICAALLRWYVTSSASCNLNGSHLQRPIAPSVLWHMHTCFTP